MKRLIVFTCCLIIFSCNTKLFAQKETCQFSFVSTIGTGISMDKPSKTPFLWNVIGYYNINERLEVGVGSGLSVYEKTLLPLFGDVKYRFLKCSHFNVFAEGAAGYSFSLNNDSNGGLYIQPSIGMEFPIHERFDVLLSVGYESQSLERLKHYENEYFESEFNEKLNHGTMLFKVGIKF